MENFVSGILISNEPYAVYEGSVFDRSLGLQLDDGQLLWLYDPDAISGDLIVGERYQVIIQPLVFILNYIENENELDFDKGLIHAKIRSLNWTLPEISSNVYRAVDGSLFMVKERFILTETLYGTVIFSSKTIERNAKMALEGLKIGHFLQWKKSRFDFVAALDPLA